MLSLGALEILMPVLQPKSNWQKLRGGIILTLYLNFQVFTQKQI